jgi:two-component system, OmpR family, phosphate regulon sensor histidine kinase PhoR
MEFGWAVAAALLAVVAYHVVNLRALIRWLDGDDPDPPRAYGMWDRLHAALFRRRRDAANRQRELEAALERWRQAARALPDGVVILDGERIDWCNDMAGVHLQIDMAKDAGRPITHIVRIPAFVGHLEAGDFSRSLQVVSPHAGERLLSLQVVEYGEGQRLVLSRDVTQLQQVERMRREFVANVSHELRTPLTVISGFVETLRDEADPEAARRYLELMAGQSGRMERLVDDLLTLSSLESSPPPPMEEPVDMQVLVERLAAEARALSGGRHRIEVRIQAAHGLLGSEKELASAFGNLVSNAIRYTPEGGEVTLRWHAVPEGAAFDVIDTGIGIPLEHVPRLTERFYRVDRGRSRETGGTGLGLAIVKHALGRHGAVLHISSQPGKGSTFSARFSGPRVRAGAGRRGDGDPRTL